MILVPFHLTTHIWLRWHSTHQHMHNIYDLPMWHNYDIGVPSHPPAHMYHRYPPKHFWHWYASTNQHTYIIGSLPHTYDLGTLQPTSKHITSVAQPQNYDSLSPLPVWHWCSWSLEWFMNPVCFELGRIHRPTLLFCFISIIFHIIFFIDKVFWFFFV